MVTPPSPPADPTTNLLALPDPLEYLLGLRENPFELLLADPREAGCEAVACAKCNSYHTSVMQRNGRDVYTCTTGDACGVNKIVGLRRRVSAAVIYECHQCNAHFSAQKAKPL